MASEQFEAHDGNAIRSEPLRSEKTGKFLPPKGDKARGELLSWLMFVTSGVGPYSVQLVHFKVYAPDKIEVLLAVLVAFSHL